ncbi:unnamed protein product [Haemonchus placei]|uniref:HTH CENPB-type domain-containing protein n=1 Tax=Haemonchus placei TaxID=6290 RepID=A0A0N4X3Q1_HAEPC|nr:unnamed protein product [Haemonchus placei]
MKSNEGQKKSAYKNWQRTRAPEVRAAYISSKRLAKAAVTKAKNTEMDALHGKLVSREGEKFVFRLAEARHRATQGIGVVKPVRKRDEGAILRTPGEVRRRWKEYFDGRLAPSMSGQRMREAMELEAQGKRPRGAPEKRWRDFIKKDFAEAEMSAENAVDRMKWRRLTGTADPATERD